MKTLHTKLLRDLWRMRLQCLTIAVLVGCGIASFVTALAAAASVTASKDAFYADAHLSDVFATLKGAPRPVLDRLSELPGVARVTGRVVSDVRLILPDTTESVTARFVSLNYPRDAGQNQTRLSSGRQVEPGSSDEVLLSQTFAEAWGIKPGGAITAVINGHKSALRVVGIAVSPEFVWVFDSHKGLPDPWHYGVAWMDGDSLARAVGLESAFNDVTIELAPLADEAETIARVDGLLEPYGGLGAVGRADQPSVKLVDQKIAQLRRLATSLPVLFLGVAGFLLYVLISRIVGAQREQIATLKALGYRARELSLHYLEFAIVICLLGVLLGCVLGVLGADAMLRVYAQYFRFPEYLFRLDAWSIVGASAVAVGIGCLGAFLAVRRAVAVPAAEAMRPESPPTYTKGPLDPLLALVGPPLRMVLRDAIRRPVRLLLSVASIALATSIVVAGNVMTDSIDDVLRVQFEVLHREDLNVTLDRARPAAAVEEVLHLPGVRRVEGERLVPVRLRSGHHVHTTAIAGISPGMDLHRLLGMGMRPFAPTIGGVSLSRTLGEELGVAAGDLVDVELLESERRKLRLPVAELVDDLLGLSGYMESEDLARVLGETRQVNTLLLQVDPEDQDDVARRLAVLPAVAAVSHPSIDRALIRAQVADEFLVLEFILSCFAAAIAVGVVYNNARISLDVRSRDLATMRILGFSRGELAVVLLGEQALQAFGVLPGLYLGRAIGGWSLRSIDQDLLRIPVSSLPASYVGAASVVLFAAVLSALVVRRRSDSLDLVAVLKARD